MQFDVVTRFRETIPTVKSVLSSEIYKQFPDFDQNYYFTHFQKIRIFSGFTCFTINSCLDEIILISNQSYM